MTTEISKIDHMQPIKPNIAVNQIDTSVCGMLAREQLKTTTFLVKEAHLICLGKHITQRSKIELAL